MAEEQVYVIARIHAREDTVDELRRVLSSLLAPTRQELGCLQYDLVQNHFDPQEFTFLERWESRAALDVHLRSGYLQEVAFALEGLLDKPVEIRLHRPVEG